MSWNSKIILQCAPENFSHLSIKYLHIIGSRSLLSNIKRDTSTFPGQHVEDSHVVGDGVPGFSQVREAFHLEVEVIHQGGDWVQDGGLNVDVRSAVRNRDIQNTQIESSLGRETQVCQAEGRSSSHSHMICGDSATKPKLSGPGVVRQVTIHPHQLQVHLEERRPGVGNFAPEINNHCCYLLSYKCKIKLQQGTEGTV